MPTVASPNNFVHRVRAEMTTQKLSIRGLARRMDPSNLDRARRNLHRWLHEGITPSRSSRIAVAIALGISEQELSGDDDEEADIVAALTTAIRRVVREEIQQEWKHRHDGDASSHQPGPLAGHNRKEAP